MADVIFKTEFVPRSASAMADRGAVLRPLSRRQLKGDSAVEAAAFQVLKLWRRRCTELREAGLAPAQGVKYQYMRNCPPAGVSMRPQNRERHTRPCNIHRVCPWCWARTIVKRTWDAVWPVMEARQSTWAKGRTEYPYRLVLGTNRVRVHGGSPAEALDLCGLGLARTAKVWAGRGIGSVLLGTVSPTRMKEGAKADDAWELSTRVISLVPPGTEYSVAFTAVEKPTRRRVAAAVARFARYPVGMMFADAGRTTAALDAMVRFRGLRMSGVFHGNTPQARGSDDDESQRSLDI